MRVLQCLGHGFVPLHLCREPRQGLPKTFGATYGRLLSQAEVEAFIQGALAEHMKGLQDAAEGGEVLDLLEDRKSGAREQESGMKG